MWLFYLILGIIEIILVVKFLEFIIKPILNRFQNKDLVIEDTPNTESKEEQKVILKSPSIDINRIKEYQGETITKFEFRPQNFKQFIGQMEAKERGKTIIKKAQRGMKAHFFLDSRPGCGKTTFVKIIANELNAKLIERVGKQIDEENIIDIINEINESKEDYVIFFVDEIDSMDKKVIKILNPIIESFEIGGKKIKPFIFVGATINKHILLKNNPDTMDRIGVHIKFKRYTDKEISTILKQYKEQLYVNDKVSEEIYNKISKNCKFNPRTSIGLLEEYIVEKDIDKVFKNCHIIKEGLTDIDIKILTILSTAKRAMGSNAISQRIGLGEKEYLREFEPYLCEMGLIARVPSRIITSKGKALLNSVGE